MEHPDDDVLVAAREHPELVVVPPGAGTCEALVVHVAEHLDVLGAVLQEHHAAVQHGKEAVGFFRPARNDKGDASGLSPVDQVPDAVSGEVSDKRVVVHPHDPVVPLDDTFDSGSLEEEDVLDCLGDSRLEAEIVTELPRVDGVIHI
ncbi:hypothetical protein ACFPRL_23405 [Pseudoclavibacter helvolus]